MVQVKILSITLFYRPAFPILEELPLQHSTHLVPHSVAICPILLFVPYGLTS